MKLFLLPLTNQRTLLYAQRLGVTTQLTERSYVDRGAAWAARKWATWESQDAGWQTKVVAAGNQLFRRIPYQEWGLKTVPPLSARRHDDELKGSEKVELVFPPSVMPGGKVDGTLLKLATERAPFHKKRLMWCLVGMPLSAPFALVPVIPNIPFFYLLYRAWSHYRAILGGRHAEWLVNNKLILETPSSELDSFYTSSAGDASKSGRLESEERLLLTQKDVPLIARTLNIPALQLELERAIEQVAADLAKQSKAKTPAESEKSSPDKEEKS